MKNKHINIKVTHISERKTRDIIRLFRLNIKAKKAAELTGVSRLTINNVISHAVNNKDVIIKRS